MSIESAKSFIERMKSDQEFAREVNELKNTEEAQRFVASKGYEFTMEDLQSCRDALSEVELASVSSGISNGVGGFLMGRGCLRY